MRYEYSLKATEGSDLIAQRGFSPDLTANSRRLLPPRFARGRLWQSLLAMTSHFLLSTCTLATLKYQMLGSAMFKQA